MEDIKDYMNIEVFPDDERETCTLSVDCLFISCSSSHHYPLQANYNFTLIPCSSPPGLAIGMDTPRQFSYSHLFIHSEVNSLSISDGEVFQFNVTLDRMENAIAVKARAYNYNLSRPHSLLPFHKLHSSLHFPIFFSLHFSQL